jgi:hypothetical protein
MVKFCFGQDYLRDPNVGIDVNSSLACALLTFLQDYLRDPELGFDVN